MPVVLVTSVSKRQGFCKQKSIHHILQPHPGAIPNENCEAPSQVRVGIEPGQRARGLIAGPSDPARLGDSGGSSLQRRSAHDGNARNQRRRIKNLYPNVDCCPKAASRSRGTLLIIKHLR